MEKIIETKKSINEVQKNDLDFPIIDMWYDFFLVFTKFQRYDSDFTLCSGNGKKWYQSETCQS